MVRDVVLQPLIGQLGLVGRCPVVRERPFTIAGSKYSHKVLADTPPHTSGPQGDWPAKSPDLNATIEHVWGYMFDKLENKRPTTINGLKRRLKKLWEDLDQDGIEKYLGCH